MPPKSSLAALATCLNMALAGCATTNIETSGTTLKQPLCDADSAAGTVSVVWASKWRVDQKEPPLREAAALRGIETFFASQPCFKQGGFRRIDLPLAGDDLSDAQLISLARSKSSAPDKIVLIVVRELGPKLWVGLPKLIEGGTEVVLDIKVATGANSSLLANLHTHWQKGGAFYIKGVKTLDQDMQAALQQALTAHTQQ